MANESLGYTDMEVVHRVSDRVSDIPNSGTPPRGDESSG